MEACCRYERPRAAQHRSSLGGKAHGVPRQDGFDITVASEVMAILCLASSLHDLKERLAKIIVAYDYNGNPVTAGQIKAQAQWQLC